MYNKIAIYIKKLQKRCEIVEALENKYSKRYDKEKKGIERYASKMKTEMASMQNTAIAARFYEIEEEIQNIINILSLDYFDEFNNIIINDEFKNLSYDENEIKLKDILNSLDSYVRKLNLIDFNKLVPKKFVEIKHDKFRFYDLDGNEEFGDYNTSKRYSIIDPKPIRVLARETMIECKRAIACINALKNQINNHYDINQVYSVIDLNTSQLIADLKKQIKRQYDSEYEEFFINEKADLEFLKIYNDIVNKSKPFEIDSDKFKESFSEGIGIGSIDIKIFENNSYLSYINGDLANVINSNVLSIPIYLDFNKCGNIFLDNVKNKYDHLLIGNNDSIYDNGFIEFINKIIMYPLMAFPFGKMELVLIDVKNKANLSRFNVLSKYNDKVLSKGIIRDDRELDSIIRDVEQRMYKILDKLSLEGVNNIFEYNKKNINDSIKTQLLVIVDFPRGFDSDLASRLLNIMENGKRYGIFIILVNNESVRNQNKYQGKDYSLFLQKAKASSLVILNDDNIKLDISIDNTMKLSKDVSIDKIASIAEKING